MTYHKTKLDSYLSYVSHLHSVQFEAFDKENVHQNDKGP